MIFEATGQAVVFLSTMYAGLAMGLGYDVLRALRWTVRAGRAVTAMLDALFCLFCLAAFLFALYRANTGRLYLYTVLGAVCGSVLYFAGISHLVLPALARVGRVVRSGFLALARSAFMKKMTK